MDNVDKALQSMIANMPEKTGKSLEEWLGILKKQSFTKHGEAVKYLKTEFGIGHGFANTIVSLSKKSPETEEEDLVSLQYKGKKALLPIYEKLIEEIKSFGDDILFVPKKSTVSVKTSKQFVLIKPATKSRIDLGLKIKDKETTDRLENSGPFGSMCTHRVKLTAVAEVDEELVAWMKEAYQKSK